MKPWEVGLGIGDLDEKEWTALAVGTKANPGLARQLAFEVYHTLRSKGSQPGYPDWTLARERLIFLELKTEKGKVSDAQAHWIRALTTAGVEVYVARPRHLDALAWVLSRRYCPRPGENPHGDVLLEELDLYLDPA